MCKIIKAKIEDVNNIRSLNQQFHLNINNFKWDTKRWIISQVKKGNYYILKQGNLVLGAINIEKNKNEYIISTLAIKEDMHKKGLGKTLLDFAKEIAIKDKARSLSVSSFLKYNLEEFYTKCGFSKQEVENYKGHPYITFSMKL
jgi:N-acetylglutamate synthase-like GNAT family acetyltransferase